MGCIYAVHYPWDFAICLIFTDTLIHKSLRAAMQTAGLHIWSRWVLMSCSVTLKHVDPLYLMSHSQPVLLTLDSLASCCPFLYINQS